MVKDVDNNLGLELLNKYFLDEIGKNPFNIYAKSIAYIDQNDIKGLIVYEDIIDRIEIDYVIVVEKYRKQGIASKMLSYLINKYKCDITLEVNSANSIAINLYKKYGFQPVTVRKNYYGSSDAILMIRKRWFYND